MFGGLESNSMSSIKDVGKECHKRHLSLCKQHSRRGTPKHKMKCLEELENRESTLAVCMTESERMYTYAESRIERGKFSIGVFRPCTSVSVLHCVTKVRSQQNIMKPEHSDLHFWAAIRVLCSRT